MTNKAKPPAINLAVLKGQPVLEQMAAEAALEERLRMGGVAMFAIGLLGFLSGFFWREVLVLLGVL